MLVAHPMGQVSGQCPERSRRTLVPINKLSAPVPPAPEWFSNIDNPNTRRASGNDVKEFMSLIALAMSVDLRLISRSHELVRRAVPDQRKKSMRSASPPPPPPA